ncbi:MAG: NUDIX domain-containing protein [Rhizobiales bacterium]|nr:NUDIX domain-containing protein [Hyphomicrobiales bacterium]NRB15005.1 NUDIX domain-containing protein [Hyphomicrobiales bacterium]
MRSHQYVLGLIADYQNVYKAEDANVSSTLFDQLNADGDVFDRKNFSGHITSSGLVLNQSFDKILLINHKFLQMWLQPGGHVEGEGEIYKEAMREVTEETALSALKLHRWHQNNPRPDIPFSIDSHNIPKSDKKHEDAHIHHDFTYLFVGDSSQKLTRQIEEVEAARWFALDDVKNLKTDIHKFIERVQKYII